MERADGRLQLEVSDDGVGGAARAPAPACAGCRTGSPRWTARWTSAARRAAAPACACGSLPVSALLRVVVAEDAFLAARGHRARAGGGGLAVVGEAADAGELLAEVREHRPDVVVTDIRMPPTHTDEGVRAAAAIRAEVPGTGVLVLSQYVKESYALALLGEAGGRRLPAQAARHGAAELRRAVREVARGGTALDPEVVAHMLERRRPGGPVDTLAERERDVLARMAEGQANRAIAGALDLSEARWSGPGAHLREARSAGRCRGPSPRARRARLPARAGGLVAAQPAHPGMEIQVRARGVDRHAGELGEPLLLRDVARPRAWGSGFPYLL